MSSYEDDDDDIDVCLGCGSYYGPYWALKNWRVEDNPFRGSVAPQLCGRCWRADGYYVTERPQ